jgi:DNA-binding MarR family transcriptional regulator
MVSASRSSNRRRRGHGADPAAPATPASPGASATAAASAAASAAGSGAAASARQAQLLTELVTQLRRALRTSIRNDIPWEALPMAQVELLQSLAEAAPARIGDLAGRLHLANSTVSGLIAQMITSGLVQRQTDASDRRAAVVTLTAAGRTQLAEWEAAHGRRIGEAFRQLAEDDRGAISAALPALGRLTQRLNEAPAQEPEPL